MLVESVAIESLIPDPANERDHGEKNLAAIKGSLAKFGQVEPLVLNSRNGVLIGGHGRLMAMKALGMTKADVVKVDLDNTQAAALRIALNRTAEIAEWNIDALQDTLRGLQADQFDLEGIGFDADDLAIFLPEPEVAGLTDEDEVPENVETRCKPGDLWQLGNHRLLCGDSTNIQHVERLMGGEKADMVFTDPPYGMNLDTDWSKGMRLAGGKPKKGAHSSMGHKGKKHAHVIGDHNDFSPDLIHSIIAIDCEETFIWGADYFAEHLSDKNSGSWVVWDKRYAKEGPIKQAMYNSEFELCWSRKKHQRLICRMVHSGICSVENDKRVHPTQKPVKLAEWFFENWGDGKSNIIDLFLGSGSTLIACEKTNRKCYGMEIDPKYCDVILSRWEKFTGKTATLEASQ